MKSRTEFSINGYNSQYRTQSQRILVLPKKGDARVGAGRPAEGTRSIWGWVLRQSKHKIYRVQVSTRLPLAHKPAMPIQQNESSSKQQTETLVHWLVVNSCSATCTVLSPCTYAGVPSICNFALGAIIMMCINIGPRISVY